MKKKKLMITLLVLAVLVLVVVVVSISNGEEEGIAVQTSKVERQKIVQTVSATGRIQPKTQVKISADVSAKILRLDVKEGDWVEKADFLLELDNERYLASVESAEANVRSAAANADLARANMVKADKEFTRTRELYEKNLESIAMLEAAQAAYEVEKSRFASAKDQVEQAQAVLKQAKDDLSKTKIFAPMAGTISALNKELGEIALGSQFQEDVIMVISNLSGMEAQVNVDENDIVLIAIGDTAKVEVDALPTAAFEGVVTEIANSASITGDGTSDQKTEFEVKIAITGTQPGDGSSLNVGNEELNVRNLLTELRPGMTASSDIITDTRRDALGIPIQSVAVRTVKQMKDAFASTEKGDGDEDDSDSAGWEPAYPPDEDGFVEVVFVVVNGEVEARQVSCGIQSDTSIEILGGLGEGEEIVIGNYRAISKELQHGSKVIVEGKSGGEELAVRS